MILANCTVSSTRGGSAVYTGRVLQIDTAPPRNLPTPNVDALLDAGSATYAMLYDDPDPSATAGWKAGDVVTVTARTGFSSLHVGTSYGVYNVVEMGGFLPHVSANLVEMPALATACTIQRKSTASDGMGGTTDTWNNLSTPNCRVTPMSGRNAEGIAETRLELVDQWVILLPAGQDVTERDRIVALGQTYEVVAVRAPQSIEFIRMVECKLVVS